MTHATTRIASLIARTIAAVALAACGSQTVRVEPVKVEPIHVTVDVNLHDAPAASAPRR
ncbi:MAG TPA: hypothetical protein VHT91_10470 [Kofleriaceae bacterium]|jgi:hypothetical protein|nr:hypothetical protein [Kofleriaceae bacterium]